MSTETKAVHTPGPWERNGSGGTENKREHYFKGANHTEIEVSSYCYNESDQAELEANAHLIAAAPDMLAALEACESHVWCECGEKDPDPIKHDCVAGQVRRAIRKAKGESL